MTLHRFCDSLGAALTEAPKTEVEFVCWPKTGVALGLAPKAGGWEGVAGKGVPKVDPNVGVWFSPKPLEGAELNANGEGAADGATKKKNRHLKHIAYLTLKNVTENVSNCLIAEINCYPSFLYSISLQLL